MGMEMIDCCNTVEQVFVLQRIAGVPATGWPLGSWAPLTSCSWTLGSSFLPHCHKSPEKRELQDHRGTIYHEARARGPSCGAQEVVPPPVTRTFTRLNRACPRPLHAELSMPGCRIPSLPEKTAPV